MTVNGQVIHPGLTVNWLRSGILSKAEWHDQCARAGIFGEDLGTPADMVHSQISERLYLPFRAAG